MVGLSLKIDVKFSNFKEFYAYYLSKHMHVWTRRCHLSGTFLTLCVLLFSFARRGFPYGFIAAPVVGYAVSWAGDAAFEGITPTSFSHPWWSFRAHMRLVREMLSGHQSI